MTPGVAPAPPGRGNRARRAEVVKATGQCQYCPPNGGENRNRRPRPDAHKTARRGR